MLHGDLYNIEAPFINDSDNSLINEANKWRVKATNTDFIQHLRTHGIMLKITALAEKYRQVPTEENKILLDKALDIRWDLYAYGKPDYSTTPPGLPKLDKIIEEGL